MDGASQQRRIFLLGATGRTGRHVVEEALGRGCEVTAIVRNPSALGPRPGLTIVEGSVVDADQIAGLLPGSHAVISCLGQGSKHDRTVLRDSARATVEAMRRSSLRRYVVVSQGLLFETANPLIALLRLLLRRHVEDSRAMEEVVRASGLDWTIVRPPYLKSGRAKGSYRAENGARVKGAWSMERADLATLLLYEALREDHVRMIVGAG